MNKDASFDLFREYASNTLAGTCNNFILKTAYLSPKTSRIYYKPQKSGRRVYRFCFSNSVDSTYEDGSRCRANTPGGEWKIVSAFAGDGGKFGEPEYGQKLSPILFSKATEKSVLPGEFFWCDEIELDIPENHYVCFEITFTGNDIPYTPDKIIPSVSKTAAGFEPDKDFPQPVFVGIKEKETRRIVFLGDSITQGLGTLPDEYEYWAAEFAKRLTGDYSVWDIGLGCGHANDAVTDCGWLKKAKTGDIVFVCFGVNDIFMNYSAEQICDDLNNIVKLLKASDCKTIILSVPPFDMTGENGEKWYAVNDYIQKVLSKEADGYFDTSSVLGKKPPLSHLSLYGSHPDGNGGRALGKALYYAFFQNNEEGRKL